MNKVYNTQFIELKQDGQLLLISAESITIVEWLL